MGRERAYRDRAEEVSGRETVVAFVHGVYSGLDWISPNWDRDRRSLNTLSRLVPWCQWLSVTSFPLVSAIVLKRFQLARQAMENNKPNK